MRPFQDPCTLYITDVKHIFMLNVYSQLLLLGIAGSLGVNRACRIPRGPQTVIEQVSQRIHPKVHSERMWGPQDSDPPAFPYFAKTGVLAFNSSRNKKLPFAIDLQQEKGSLTLPNKKEMHARYQYLSCRDARMLSVSFSTNSMIYMNECTYF